TYKARICKDGCSVGHAHEGGAAPAGGRAPRGGKGLAMLESRLAGRDHHVNDPRGEHAPATVDDLGVAKGACRDVAAEIDNTILDDQEAAKLIETRSGIDQARINKRNRAAGRALVCGGCVHGRHWFGRWRAKA